MKNIYFGLGAYCAKRNQISLAAVVLDIILYSLIIFSKNINEQRGD